MSGAFTKICAKKSPHPRASTFRHGNDDRVAARKFTGAAAEIPAHDRGGAGGNRKRSRLMSHFAHELGVTLRERIERISPFHELPSAQSKRLSQLGIFNQAADGLDPSVFAPSEKPVFAGSDDLVVHADIGGDDGRAHSHVLQNFVTA